MGQQRLDLLAGEHSRKGVVIFGADLRKEGPVRFAQQLDKEHFGRGQCLPDAFGLPVLLQFDEKEILAQLGLGDGGGITGQMLVDEAELTIVSMAGPVGVVTQRQEVREWSAAPERRQ